jgi:tetratricopeptide (TPR) repeat protein
MRHLALLLLAFATLAQAQPATPAPAGRDAAYERLRDQELFSKLLEQTGNDLKKRHYQAALKKAEAAEKLAPGNAEALNAQGAALVELKRYDEAAKALADAVAADPNSLPARYNQAEMLAMQKKYDDAAADFALLETQFGPQPLIKYKIFLCKLLAGDTDDAETALRRMRYPEDGAAWYFAHVADRLKAGQRGEAKRLLSAAEAIHGDETATYLETLQESGLLK